MSFFPLRAAFVGTMSSQIGDRPVQSSGTQLEAPRSRRPKKGHGDPGESTMKFHTSRISSTAGEPLDPLERYVPLLLRLGVYAFLTLFFFQAKDAFAAYDPTKPWPGLLFVVRTFTFLPLHEGGHFLNMFFGRTLYVLGGSFWQIMFPLLWVAIAAKQRSQVAPFPLFWVGENMMDVSLYIRDAPFRVLPLLGGHKSGHDWYYLLSRWDAMDWAGNLADIAYFGGAFICVAAITAGVVWAVLVFIRPGRSAPAEITKQIQAELAVEDVLDRTVKSKERQLSL